MKLAFCFLPSFKTVIKRSDETIADVNLETLRLNVFSSWKIALSGQFVSTVAIADNGKWISHMCNMAEQGMGL